MENDFRKDQGVLFSFGVLVSALFGTGLYLAVIPLLLLFLLTYKRGRVIEKIKRAIRQGSFYLLGGLIVWILALLISIE